MSDPADNIVQRIGAIPIEDYFEIREILKSRAFVQAANQMSAEFMAGAVNTLDGPEHFQRRRVMGHIFSAAALERYKAHDLRPVIEQTLRELLAQHDDGDPTLRADLVPLVWRMLYRLAGAVTGVDGLDEPAAVDRFIDSLQAAGEILTLDWAKTDAAAVYEQGEQAAGVLREEYFDPSIATRRSIIESYEAGRVAREDVPTDLFTLLMLHKEADAESGLLHREAIVFLFGATQTTAQAFPHYILHLESWFAADPARRGRIEADPRFLSRAAFESLRFFTASPARLRRATERVELSSGRVIEPGNVVALYFLPANQDPDVFGAHADAFDPDREVLAGPEWGLAFGGGTHACIGRPLVTGVGSRGDSDGSMATIAKTLYGAGLRLDPERDPSRDESTFYDKYASVPVILERSRLEALLTEGLDAFLASRGHGR